jgi:hypothetical protein
MRQPGGDHSSALPIASQEHQPDFARLAGNEVEWHSNDDASIALRACVLCPCRLPGIQPQAICPIYVETAARRSGGMRNIRSADRQTGCHDEALSAGARSDDF